MNTEDRFIDNLRKRVGKTLYQFDMVKENDKVLVGLSGGKDSLILTECLALRRKVMPFHFDIIAVHVKVKNLPYETDIDYLQSFCDNLGVEFQYREEEIELDTEKLKQKGYCFICSWNRRKILFKTAREFNCNKLALGHHMDDALETLMMNLAYHGSISSMPQTLSMFDGDLILIRPLMQLPEDNLIKYAQYRNYPSEIKRCGFGSNTGRNNMKDLLHLMEKISPNAKKNMFRAMDNIYPEYLPKREPKKNQK